jgi:phosphoenolpyruvate carboxylase
MFEPTVCDTLGTFDAIAEIPPESLGAYVISMSQSASDVLAVRLLQAEAGVARPMRVVPLFETLDDLSNAPGIMESLWNTSWYKGDIDGKPLLTHDCHLCWHRRHTAACPHHPASPCWLAAESRARAHYRPARPAGKQEVMLGYSDSAKDAGRLAAAWAQYQTQEQLVTAANKHGISLSLFHGASRGCQRWVHAPALCT